jgi:hypothetical protein
MLWEEWSQQGLNAMGKLVADIVAASIVTAWWTSLRSEWRAMRLAPSCTAVKGTSGKW